MKPSFPVCARVATLAGSVLLAAGFLVHQPLIGSDRVGGRYNLLFIVVDDLRPVLGCYGKTAVRTPNIDGLAARGVVFENAYCQAASCLPSRTSVLTGLRVGTTGITSNRDGHFRRTFPRHTTLPQHFKNHGYFCMEFGKVFHEQDPVSFSVPKFIPKSEYAYPIYGKPETLAFQKKIRVNEKPPDWWGFQEGRNSRWVRAVSWEDPDVRDEVLFDGQVAEAVVEVLRARRNERFFLASGFFRPHLPFIAPRKYFELYPTEDLKLPPNRELPEGAPPFVHYDSAESRSYMDIGREGPIPESKQLELLRGYYASVSYVDAQIGRILRELDTLGLRDSTLVVLWSDHGYHFGEHGTWNKGSNFEVATRSTLIVSVPGMESTGTRTTGLVELIDLYPTLSELCGLAVPSGLEGTSFAGLLQVSQQSWKKAAFSQITAREVPGYSMRTDRYRYTEWRRGEELVAVELYDHETDPEENYNIAGRPENRALVDALAGQFSSGWKAALPEGRMPNYP